ncbi:hypothetical protein MBOT_28090 [Mycobacterium botniense]|uniref:Uncharacterized protein n=1 Tax=Mycobacterium botniense TaxID=84962 RepID=A0A7I9Y089_9MYCO|nr:hypothetical protein MBOT_28090 [Mycobacterium botniense]
MPQHHGNRREGEHTGAAQLARAGHIVHVADTAEQQGIQIVAIHPGEHLCAPLRAQASEIDTGTVLEAHHSDEHATVTGHRAHAVRL